MNEDFDVLNDDGNGNKNEEPKNNAEIRDKEEGGGRIDSNKTSFHADNIDTIKSENAPISYNNNENSGHSGVMSNSVGTGKYAKTNIIWYIVSASFVVFSCISIALFVLVVYGYGISELTQSIKDMWGIFTPVLTLSLGYLFGKQGRSKQKDGKKQNKSIT